MKTTRLYKYLVPAAVMIAACSCLLLPSSGNAFQPEQLAEKILDYVRANYPWAAVELENVAFSPEITDACPMPEGIRVEKGPPGKSVFVLEFGDGRKVTVSANVKAFDRIFLTRRAMGRGSRIMPDDVFTTMMELSRIPKDVVTKAEQFEGRTLTRSVIANAPIVKGMVSDTVQVKKGQRVLLVAESGGFSITAAGEMRESGRVGNHVKVLNTASKKTVSGLLFDENTVRVDF